MADLSSTIPRWGEAELLDALRAQHDRPTAEDMREVFQEWFERGSGLAVFQRTADDNYRRFVEWRAGTDLSPIPPARWALSGTYTLVACIPPSPVPPVQ